MSKTCGNCRYYKNGKCYFNNTLVCAESIHPCWYFNAQPTNGDRIRQGGDDALIEFADGVRRRMCHCCAFFKEKSCVDKTCGCWEGVRLWLNAPAESEGEDEEKTV
jgi:hypothetical protein